MDSAGNLYIADTDNNRIRKVSNGVITTVAGNGTQGFSGDNGPATSAQLYIPGGVAVDSAGNLYIADTYNNRIRKVSNGVITTVAGNGTVGFGGDNGPATSAQLNTPVAVAVDSAGNLYIADTNNNRIRLLTPGTRAHHLPQRRPDPTRLLGVDLRNQPGKRDLPLERRFPKVLRRHHRDHRQQAGVPLVRQPHADQPAGARRHHRQAR